jgi:hypothetical protein
MYSIQEGAETGNTDRLEKLERKLSGLRALMFESHSSPSSSSYH